MVILIFHGQNINNGGRVICYEMFVCLKAAIMFAFFSPMAKPKLFQGNSRFCQTIFFLRKRRRSPSVRHCKAKYMSRTSDTAAHTGNSDLTLSGSNYREGERKLSQTDQTGRNVREPLRCSASVSCSLPEVQHHKPPNLRAREAKIHLTRGPEH